MLSTIRKYKFNKESKDWKANANAQNEKGTSQIDEVDARYLGGFPSVFGETFVGSRDPRQCCDPLPNKSSLH